ncbi:MAG TPA: prepilin-type N-terminal cleavage/methylation domain-containing protein [Nannocystaceae bacterium]|nr:prepilin-type N-terminal cleavage/methylation domain-containing protein [Nannocystaceae bacterium]
MRKQAGFTLIEMMVAIVVSAIVVLGVFAFANIQRANATAFERNVRIQQALEGAMWTIGQDVRQAGLGFTRICSELRVWDQANARLVNPGVADPNFAVADAITGERYWVLRDGIQAHWRSEGAGSIDGGAASSAAAGSAADSFDVILGEPNYSNAIGVFHLGDPIDGGDATLVVETSTLLDSTNVAHVAQVQQLFPPGTFVVVARRPGLLVNPVSPNAQGQCVLLQVTGDVIAGADPQRWEIPIGSASGFNADLAQLVADDGVVPPCTAESPACVDDWDATTLDAAMVVPVGRLRWSRYELDYFIPTLPYLVRYDLIGWQEGDLDGLGGVDYPHCTSGNCVAPQLHLPGGNPGPAAVAIAPMVEDMQVAVGCDGWSSANAAAAGRRVPDVGFEELGPAEGALAGVANVTVDENRTESGQRNADEWLGNAQSEASAPDCVAYGTAEGNAATWVTIETDPGPAFRMSPQTMRVTLLATDETVEAAGGIATNQLMAIEDRPELPSLVGTRQRFSLTERYAPENLHWRDSTVR